MSEIMSGQSEDLPEEERELSRLLEIFKANVPLPRDPSSTDKATILRYLDNAPSLTTFRKSGLERFLANVGVLPDGRVICTISSPLVQSDFEFRPLGWGSKFGSCLRLLLRTDKIPTQAVLIPGEKSFGALQSSRIVFVSYRLGRVQTIKEFNLASSSEAQSAFRELVALCARNHAEIVAMDSYIIDPNLVRANSVSVKYFAGHWTRLEWLQRGWIEACARRGHHVLSSIGDAKGEITNAFKLPLVQKYGLLYEVLCTLNNSDLSKSAQVSEVIGKYKRLPINQLIKEVFALDRELSSIDRGDAVTIRRTFPVAYEIWNLLELDPELSDWGRLQISWDPLGREIAPATLDPYNFPIEKDEDAACYWERKKPNILANRDQLLSPSDLLLDVRCYVEGFSTWQPDLDETEAAETITQLLNEAVALREWTIPPNAFCEIQVGPFIGAEVTEIGDDVSFIWRTANNRYWDMSVDVVRQVFANTEVPARDTRNPHHRKAELSIQLLMSAIIRDFWVVTERQKIFGVRRRRTARAAVDDDQRRVIYLPRIRYLGPKIDLKNLNLGLSYKSRSQHYVRPFFRKAKPSPLQMEIARRARVIVPEGHTYVRGHYRGIEGTKVQTTYRSRSAMALLFQTAPSDHLIASDHLASTDWFGFERAVGVLLERHFGFTIEHRATRGKTDYGVDILATKSVGTQIETWVVQCKCYKPSNLVKPSHIRELVGAIADTRTEDNALVRGMMVTTSRFSGDALKLALKHGIQCIGGDDLNLVLDAINRASNTNPLH